MCAPCWGDEAGGSPPTGTPARLVKRKTLRLPLCRTSLNEWTLFISTAAPHLYPDSGLCPRASNALLNSYLLVPEWTASPGRRSCPVVWAPEGRTGTAQSFPEVCRQRSVAGDDSRLQGLLPPFQHIYPSRCLSGYWSGGLATGIPGGTCGIRGFKNRDGWVFNESALIHR